MTTDIVKIDEDQHLVFGWASVISENERPCVDAQGDVIGAEELEKSAYEFVLTSRKAGSMHQKIGIGKLVESVVLTKSKQQALGIDLGREGWFVGFKIEDESVWRKIKSGELGALSIHGRAHRAEI